MNCRRIMSFESDTSSSNEINNKLSESVSGEKSHSTSSENQISNNQGSDKMIYNGQMSSGHSEGMSVQAPGASHLTAWQNSGNTQQNIPAVKLIEVILHSLHSKEWENKLLKERCDQLELKMRKDSYEKKEPLRSGREPVSRSKSAPESFSKHLIHQANDVRKSSDPEIFLFPDTKHKTVHNTANIPKNKTPDGVSEDGLKDSLENRDMGSQGEDSNEFLSLKDSFHEPPGVSAQYFDNVINELVKTKTYLHNLQMKQKCHKCEGTSENQMEKMRNEIQQLRLENQKLQRNLAAKEEEMAQVKQEPAQMKDESFELSTESEAEISGSSKNDSTPGVQVSAEVEIQRLREEIDDLNEQKNMILQEKEELHKMLMKDNHEINRELIQLNDAYDKLKENVKILGTCLHEEKVRCKNTDDKLRTKTDESRKISSQLGSLRAQYEELRQEKNALEKTRSLEDTPSVRFSSPRSHTGSSEFNRSGGSNRSGEYGRYGSNRSGHSPFTSRTESYNIRPENWPPRLVSQNDLSTADNEPKELNLPFSAATSAKFSCPRCLRNFQLENSYQIHMQSCLD